MRAVVQDRYGSADSLRVSELDRPVVADDEVLVRVRAASVHPDVWHVVTGRPYVLRLMGSGLRRPRNQVPGTDLAGEVVGTGAGVTRFAVGDEVFGETLRGFQWANGGAFAEYATAPESGLARKPANVSFEQAAAVPTSGLIAWMNLVQAGLRDGEQQVLVNGAAGGVGTLAVQLARAHGATVTAVDAGPRLALVSALGADAVVDYREQDFTRGAGRYDLIFDIPGNHRFGACRRVLAPGGVYVLIGHDRFGHGAGRWVGNLPRVLGLMARSVFDHALPRPSFKGPDKAESMAMMAGLLESGALTPVVGATYPLDDAPMALRRLAAGDVLGKIVITP